MVGRVGAPSARPRQSTAKLVATQTGWEPRAEGRIRVIARGPSGDAHPPSLSSQRRPLKGPPGEFKVPNEGEEEAF